VAFPANGAVAPPSEILRKKAILLAPGTFQMVEDFHKQMLQAGIEELKNDSGNASPIAMFSLSATQLTKGEERSAEELLYRIQELLGHEVGVLLTNKKELYHTIHYANRYTKESIRAVVGLATLIRVLEDAYDDLEGRTLEGIARLFSQNVRIYAYPTEVSFLQSRNLANTWEIKSSTGIVTADQIRPKNPLGFLYDYLLACKFIHSLHPR